MADFAVISRVTEHLEAILSGNLGYHPQTKLVGVSHAPLDKAKDPPQGSNYWANLYLYHIVENPYLKNQELPSRGQPGAYGHPPLSLNLHYLLTVYSDSTSEEVDIVAQEILGNAMHLLHEHAIIQHNSEFEHLRITLQPLPVSDLVNLWSVFPTSDFRRSVAYEVTVVQIESQQFRTAALPVQERNVRAFPLPYGPVITEVRREGDLPGAPDAAVRAEDILLIRGSGLSGPNPRVVLGTRELPPSVVTSAELKAKVPKDLPTGVYTVHMLYDQVPERPGTTQSNTAACMLVPKIESVTSPGSAGDIITVKTTPPPGQTQPAFIVFGSRMFPATWAQPNPAAPPVLTYQVPNAATLPVGKHLVRVRVEGAESLLEYGPDPQDPEKMVYLGPTCKIDP